MRMRAKQSENSSGTLSTTSTRITSMGVVRGAKALFFCMDEEDVNRGVDDRKSTPNTPNIGDGGIEPGKRTSKWFRDIEDDVEENTDRSISNQNYLKRMDWRTVWIMRALVALIGAVGSGLILQVVLFYT